MYAVAEVFEDDIGRVRVGQPALVSSPVLENPISGVVEQIGYKIGKLDVLADDRLPRPTLAWSRCESGWPTASR